MSWTLADLQTKFRALTRRSSTGDIADAAVTAYLNDYLRFKFPQEVQLNRLDDTWSQNLAVTDAGEYSVSDNIINIKPPVVLNGREELRIYFDLAEFWRIFPAEEDYTMPPTLVVGTTDAASVRNSSFRYTVSGDQYAAAAGETALSGDAVPESMYGAWMLDIDEDGDITVTEADDNATGYATPALAIAAIPSADSDHAVMGVVTALCSSGVFTPGTTELNTGASVTATFTDGNPRLRGRPEAILLTRNEGYVFVRPKPNDAYVITSPAVLQRPTALSEATDTLPDDAWGLAIALGASVEFLAAKEGESERMMELIGGFAAAPSPGCLAYELMQIRRHQLLQQNPHIERYW